MTGHLNDEQLDRLLQSEASMSADDEGGNREARAHVDACDVCRNAMLERRATVAILEGLRSTNSHEAGEACPSADIWVAVAAGIPDPDREKSLRHSVICDRCALLLRHAAEDLADKETAEEVARLDVLASGTEAWQRRTAEHMSKPSRVALDPNATTNRQMRPFGARGSFRFWVLTGGFAALAAISALVVWFRPRTGPDELVQRAFAENRTIEVRIEDAPWAPLRQERGRHGTLSDTDRLALVKAKDAILPEFKSHPNDVYWLDRAARLYLIQNDTESVQTALELLTKAHGLDADNASVTIDLASAYLLSADLMGLDDHIGDAINLLASLEKSSGASETALWNYAIAEERAKKWDGALSAWQRFSQQYPHSTWAGEARDRLNTVQHLLEEQRKQSQIRLRTIKQVAIAFSRHDAAVLREIDRRIEEYQDSALEDWLPILFSTRLGETRSLAEEALNGLAHTLASEHGDSWLAEMLSADTKSPALQNAMKLLARSARSVEASDVPGAERDALAAESLFRTVGFEAGTLRARLTIIFAQQYEHRDQTCRISAQRLLTQPSLTRYPWISIQASLESAICSPVADSAAMHAVEMASKLAQNDRFPILCVRALSAESSLLALMGDSNHAWTRALQALDLYWQGGIPTLRGYNALIALAEIDRYGEEWALQADLLAEAIKLLKDDPRTMMLAVANAQLAQALLQTGDLSGADSSFNRAETLMSISAPGRERDSLWAEVELGISRIELERDRVKTAAERLQRIRPAMIAMNDSPLQIEFLYLSGTSLLRMNRLKESEQDLSLAVELTKGCLGRIASNDDRWKSSRKYEDLYRNTALLKLHSDPQAALTTWESLKTAALPRSGEQGALSLPGDSRAVFLTYMALPKGLVVWVWDGTDLHERRIDLNVASLGFLISRFVEESSDPASEVSALRRDGASLYSEIVAPIESWIEGRSSIVIEPDGPLKKIPFVLLVDGQGSYLGDHHDIAISPGLPYLSGARPWSQITLKSAVFILANPKSSGWAALPSAEEEGRTVASFFAHPRLVDGSVLSATDVVQEASRSELFHFAGHAYAAADRVGLVASSSGIIPATDFSSLFAGRTTLVVLSACNTSSGTNGLFDGDSSMVRSLLAARVRYVVASRWNAESSSTALLMKLFYSRLREDKSVAAALGYAMRGVRMTPEYRHPYYWAAFSVFGNV